MAQLKIRLPTDLKEFIEAQAKLNSSSQNSEIIRCIRATKQTKTAVREQSPNLPETAV